ncbi:MAG: DUF899 family protein [Trebonia sp.]
MSQPAGLFGGKSQLIVYSHMWFPGEEWQCPGCTGFTAQFTRLEFLDNYDARFVIVTQGPIDEALAYKRRVGNKMTWYSTANSLFGSDRGPGIADEDLPHIFERFYRAPDARGMPGAGLGLAIVGSVAQANEGTVEVRTGPAGSAFTLAFPSLENAGD